MLFKNKLKNLYFIQMGLGGLIIIYFFIMKYIFKKKASLYDPLNKKIISIPILGKTCCSYWPLSHIVAFAVFSYIWPQYIHHIFFLGIVWELVEYVLKIILTKKGEELKFKRTRDENNNIEYTNWWGSSSKDLIFNAIGIGIGYGFRKIM